MFEILIIILTISILIIIHELGHFLVAKKFGVKVEEFGLGLPPRLFGKKIGETIFSLNLIPFGGFVRMYGEEEDIKNPQSFTGKSIWQRALIVFAGVAAFWIIAVILLTILFNVGAPIAISDDEDKNLTDIRVQIATVIPGSPAEKAGLEIGDTIRKLKIKNEKLKITKIKEVREFANLHKGEEIILTIQRGKEIFDVALIPRVEAPEGEGPMGVALVRTAIKSFSWYEAPIKGTLATVSMTGAIIQGLGQIIESVVKGEPMPPGVEVMGPVGIFDLMEDRLQMGIVYFLKLTVILTIHLAIFNLLPIPALDGGKLLFLGIEAVRGRPISQRIEQNITAVFFFLLIALMIFITIQDIIRIF
jgi:regulator of sigma E protease